MNLEKELRQGVPHVARARHADVFAIATERLAWQRGQNLFDAVRSTCAGEVLMIDAHGGFAGEGRVPPSLGTPARLTKEAISQQ